MRNSLKGVLGAASLLALAGCNLAPHYTRPAAPVPPQWPQGAAYAPNAEATPGMPWRQMITAPKLVRVIEQALAESRTVREQVAAVAEARATYHIDRAALLPEIDAAASADITRGLDTKSVNSSTYSVGASMPSFEIDLFGRLHNEAKAGFESYLATQSGLREAKLTLVEETAQAYVTLAADSDLLRIDQADLASAQKSLELTQSLFHSGLENGGDLQSAVAEAETQKSEVAAQTTAVAQDKNALDLLVGHTVAPEWLPASLAELDATIANVPAGLSSQVLLQRPDVVEAEHTLLAANADIGAARAAFFPTITLTSALGLTSTALSRLFTGGAAAWTVEPEATMPIFGGTTRGTLEYDKAQKEYDIAAYDLAVQTAFRDVANGLARRGTIVDQRAAQARSVEASRKAWVYAEDQFKSGIGTYLTALTDERTYYAAQQTQVATQQSDLTNRVSLYAAIGADGSL